LFFAEQDHFVNFLPYQSPIKHENENCRDKNNEGTKLLERAQDEVDPNAFRPGGNGGKTYQ
jgi:hypothetical protein